VTKGHAVLNHQVLFVGLQMEKLAIYRKRVMENQSGARKTNINQTGLPVSTKKTLIAMEVNASHGPLSVSLFMVKTL